jgi:tryptophanyl-tRNA synthetase
MARILTGIQSTGVPHLGNLLGAIRPAIDLASASDNESYLFIADLHSLTQIKDGETLRNNTRAVAAAWLAMGLDTERTVFYRQSDIPEVTELAWYLSCYFPYNRLTLAHSFKDKADRLADVNAGLFSYPMLMAADILLYDADFVPVGKDQLQHLEMTRDVASRFNHKVGEEIFVIPREMTQRETMYVPGLDGGKMSKSRDNVLNVFDDPKALKKRINKEIVTDATALEDPKDPDSNPIVALYAVVAGEQAAAGLGERLRAGGLGWGHAKQELLAAIVDGFATERDAFHRWFADPQAIDNELTKGAEKAKPLATNVLSRVRRATGY